MMFIPVLTPVFWKEKFIFFYCLTYIKYSGINRRFGIFLIFILNHGCSWFSNQDTDSVYLSLLVCSSNGMLYALQTFLKWNVAGDILPQIYQLCFNKTGEWDEYINKYCACFACLHIGLYMCLHRWMKVKYEWTIIKHT